MSKSRVIRVPSKYTAVARTLYVEDRNLKPNEVTLSVVDNTDGRQLTINVDKYLLLDAIEPLR